MFQLQITIISKGLKKIWLMFLFCILSFLIEAKLNPNPRPVLLRQGQHALSLATWFFVYCSAPQTARY